MFLRPKRSKTGWAFLAGLSLSVLLLAGGYLFYRMQEARVMERITLEAAADAQASWEAAHPMEAVYVFSRDMKAGDVLSVQEMVLREIPFDALPNDAMLDPTEMDGMVVRSDVTANTLCTRSLMYGMEEYPDDARIQEFTSIRLPSRLEPNQCVDVRIAFPNGLDYVVLAKKTIRDLEYGDSGQGQKIWLTVDEEEILRISSAIVDACLHPGTVMYALTYVAPDVQEAAVCTYPANTYVLDMIQSNPNILAHAVSELDRVQRSWFDAIPDPQPNQPLASVPAPDEVLKASEAGLDGRVSATPQSLSDSTSLGATGASAQNANAGAQQDGAPDVGTGGGSDSTASSASQDGHATSAGASAGGTAGTKDSGMLSNPMIPNALNEGL